MNSPFKLSMVSAIGFVGVAIFDNVHAWPIVFPLVGGIAAMAVNKSHADSKGYGSILLYGFYATLLVILLAIPLMWLRAKEAILEQVQEMGYEGSGVSFFEVAAIIILSMAAIFFITFLVGTLLGLLFPGRKYEKEG